jgi:hypothetical protein
MYRISLSGVFSVTECFEITDSCICCHTSLLGMNALSLKMCSNVLSTNTLLLTYLSD